jgi:hypothetical protein
MTHLLMTLAAFAAEPVPLDAEAYAAQIPLEGPEHKDFPKIEACLRAWGPDHPFTTPASRRFRPVKQGVRVLGFGAPDRTYDELRTEQPELVLVDTSVVVLSNSYLWLENPNGWYCLDRSVAVGGRVVINAACGANIADATDSFVVLGKNIDREGGVNVVGKLRVNELCDDVHEDADPDE